MAWAASIWLLFLAVLMVLRGKVYQGGRGGVRYLRRASQPAVFWFFVAAHVVSAALLAFSGPNEDLGGLSPVTRALMLGLPVSVALVTTVCLALEVAKLLTIRLTGANSADMDDPPKRGWDALFAYSVLAVPMTWILFFILTGEIWLPPKYEREDFVRWLTEAAASILGSGR